MTRSLSLGLLMAGVVVATGACKSNDATEPDAAVLEDLGPGGEAPPLSPDKGATPDRKVLTSYKVAAVQYSSGSYTAVSGCKDDLCAFTSYIKDAAKNGAQLVVFPEGTIDAPAEPAPAVGDAPATDSRWAEGTPLRTLAKAAIEQEITVAFNDDCTDGGKHYNTNIALGPDGKVLARHYKFQLYPGEEKYFTPGTSIEHSFFDTPAGRAGMMVCADAQCIVTGLAVTTDCTKEAVALLKDYFGSKKPQLLVFSEHWMVGGTGLWGAMPVQKKMAKDGQVYLVAANNIDGQGLGGGVYDPTGNALAQDSSGKPAIVYAELPLKK